MDPNGEKPLLIPGPSLEKGSFTFSPIEGELGTKTGEAIFANGELKAKESSARFFSLQEKINKRLEGGVFFAKLNQEEGGGQKKGEAFFRKLEETLASDENVTLPEAISKVKKDMGDIKVSTVIVDKDGHVKINLTEGDGVFFIGSEGKVTKHNEDFVLEGKGKILLSSDEIDENKLGERGKETLTELVKNITEPKEENEETSSALGTATTKEEKKREEDGDSHEEGTSSVADDLSAKENLDRIAHPEKYYYGLEDDGELDVEEYKKSNLYARSHQALEKAFFSDGEVNAEKRKEILIHLQELYNKKPIPDDPLLDKLRRSGLTNPEDMAQTVDVDLLALQAGEDEQKIAELRKYYQNHNPNYTQRAVRIEGELERAEDHLDYFNKEKKAIQPEAWLDVRASQVAMGPMLDVEAVGLETAFADNKTISGVIGEVIQSIKGEDKKVTYREVLSRLRQMAKEENKVDHFAVKTTEALVRQRFYENVEEALINFDNVSVGESLPHNRVALSTEVIAMAQALKKEISDENGFISKGRVRKLVEKLNRLSGTEEGTKRIIERLTQTEELNYLTDFFVELSLKGIDRWRRTVVLPVEKSPQGGKIRKRKFVEAVEPEAKLPEEPEKPKKPEKPEEPDEQEKPEEPSLPPAPEEPIPEDNPPKPEEPPLTEDDLTVAVVSDPTRVEQNVGQLVRHVRAREKPARGLFGSLTAYVIHPVESARNFLQNVIFRDAFDARAVRFVDSITKVARKHAGLDSSVPYQLPQEILDRAMEEGKKIRQGKGFFKKIAYKLQDIFSGATGIIENTDMRFAREWFDANGKPLIDAAKEVSLKEQTELGKRFALKGTNEEVISSIVGEKRYRLNELVSDKKVLEDFNKKISELVRGYLDGGMTKEQLLKEFNKYYKTNVYSHFSPDKQKELAGVELSSSVLALADKLKGHEDLNWDDLKFNVYVGKARYEATRGDVRLNILEKLLIRHMVEKNYRMENNYVLEGASRLANLAVDSGIYGGLYFGGLKYLGRKFIGGPAAVIAMAGLRQGVSVTLDGKKGKLYGTYGQTLEEFTQASRERAMGRQGIPNARIRKEYEKVMVDQRSAEDLWKTVEPLLAKETLAPDEQKRLLMNLAHIKARLDLTDLTTQGGKTFLGVGKIAVAQNFISFSEDKRNEELTHLRAILVQGGAKLATLDPTLYAQMDNVKEVYMAQLQVGSKQNEVAKVVSKKIGINFADANNLVGQYWQDLGIAKGQSLQKATRALSRLTWKKAIQTAAMATVMAPVMGTEFKLAEGTLVSGVQEGGLLGSAVIHGDFKGYGAHLGMAADHWNSFIHGVPPVEKDASGHFVSALNPLQQSIFHIVNGANASVGSAKNFLDSKLGWHLTRPMGTHTATIDNISVKLPDNLHYVNQGNGNDYIVNIQTGHVVDLSRVTLGQDSNGNLVIKGNSSEVTAFNNWLQHSGAKVQSAGPPTEKVIFNATGSKLVPEKLIVNGQTVKLEVPQGTHLVFDHKNGTVSQYRLEAIGTHTVLAKDINIDSSGHVSGGTSAAGLNFSIHSQMTGGGTRVTTLSGSNAVHGWNSLASAHGKDVWWTNGTKGSDYNELRFYDKVSVNSHGHYVLDLIGPKGPGGIHHPNEVPDVAQVAASSPHGMQILLHIPGVKGDVKIDMASDGVKDNALRLNPDDMTHHVLSDGHPLVVNGHSLTVGELSHMLVNQKALSSHLHGARPTHPIDLGTERRGWLDVFNVAHNGKHGYVEAVFTNHKGEVHHLATIRGSGSIQFDRIVENPAKIASSILNLSGKLTKQIPGKIEINVPTNYTPFSLTPFTFIPIPVIQNIEKSVRGQAKSSLPTSSPSTPSSSPSDSHKTIGSDTTNKDSRQDKGEKNNGGKDQINELLTGLEKQGLSEERFRKMPEKEQLNLAHTLLGTIEKMGGDKTDLPPYIQEALEKQPSGGQGDNSEEKRKMEKAKEEWDKLWQTKLEELSDEQKKVYIKTQTFFSHNEKLWESISKVLQDNQLEEKQKRDEIEKLLATGEVVKSGERPNFDDVTTYISIVNEIITSEEMKSFREKYEETAT